MASFSPAGGQEQQETPDYHIFSGCLSEDAMRFLMSADRNGGPGALALLHSRYRSVGWCLEFGGEGFVLDEVLDTFVNAEGRTMHLLRGHLVGAHELVVFMFVDELPGVVA